MTTVTVDDDLMRQILSAELPINLLNPQGQVIGTIEKFDDEAEEIRGRLNIPTPNKSGD